MIEYFNDVEVRNSGVIYSSIFDQIRKMYSVDPDMAGELAISAIELVLTGQISSDDPMIDMLLTPAKVINDNNVQKYELKKENSRTKKIKDMKLQEIADLYIKGVRQREIAERLNLTQQTVSYRISLIKTNYQDLLQPEGTETALYQNTNNFTKKQTTLLQNGSFGQEAPQGSKTAQTISPKNGFLPKNLQTNSDVYQNTKDTKSENLVILQEGKMFVKNGEEVAEEKRNSIFDF